MKEHAILTDVQIGEAIRKRRHELGMTQEELAERIEVTSQQVQRYEYGKTRLKIENLQVIAQVLSVPVTYFFGEQGGEGDLVSVPHLNPTELKLLEQFRMIKNEEVRELVINVLRQAAIASL